MSSEERNAWIGAVLGVIALVVYTVILLSRADGAPLTEVPYVDLMLWTIGISIVVTIVVTIIAAIFSPKDRDKKDRRDKEIHRFGEYAGQSLLVVGSLGALLLALAEADHFWIANALFLGFLLSAILGSIVKIVAYRRGFVAW